MSYDMHWTKWADDARPGDHLPPGWQLSPNRVQHPGMAERDDIQPGVIIHCHDAAGGVTEYEVIDVAEDTFTVRYTRADMPHITVTRWFSDAGIAPYPGGWNPTNYITVPHVDPDSGETLKQEPQP